MNKILGIDLGSNSIGWAIRDLNEIGNQITNKGVLTFEKGVADVKGIETPMVAKRTESRGKRRNYQAEKYRKWELLKILIDNKMCPLTIEELNEWKHYTKGAGRKYPQSKNFIEWLRFDFDGDGKPDFHLLGLDKHESYYAFRAMIIIEAKKDVYQKNKEIIGRVLYQIVQRRGYNNIYNLTENDKSELSGTIMKGGGEAGAIGVNEIAHYLVKHKTLGAALYYMQKETKARIRKRYNLRSDFENEIDEICKIQNLTHLKEPLKKAIIWQRPLRSQKGLIGYCTLDRPLKSKTGYYYKVGSKRIALSHPLYEEFRTWVDINNLKLESPKELNLNEFIEKEVFPIFNKATDFHFSNKKDKNGKETKGLRDKIENLGGKIHAKFDLDLAEDADGKKYKANKFLNKIEKIFGNNWREILKWNDTLNNIDKPKGTMRVEDIWHLFYDAIITKSQNNISAKIIPILQKHFPTIEFNENDFKTITLDKGYASLSEKTIKCILPYLKKGMLYSHAVFVANLEKVLQKKLDPQTLEQLKEDYTEITKKINKQKEVNNIINSLISDSYNENNFGKGNNYVLIKIDIDDINRKIKDNFKTKIWNAKTDAEKDLFIENIKEKYQHFLQQDIHGTDKGSQFYKTDRIADRLKTLLIEKYKADPRSVEKNLWHPSEQEVYSPAYIKADKDGVVITNDEGKEIYFLGDPNPISKGFKNPMAIKTLQYLKKLLNYLLEHQLIDSSTKINLEIARELNDANMRSAIQRYQSDRKKIRDSFKKEIKEYFDEQKKENKTISEDLLVRYELWIEQNKKCMYCTECISSADVFNGKAEKEHTIPEPISHCNEMFNLTIAHKRCNGPEGKAKRYPTQWTDNYELIKNNVKFMYAKYMSFKEKHEETYKKAKSASDKATKDRIIQSRHYYKFYLSYWKKKYETFTLEEVTNQFRRQQLVDTQIVTKYALPYLKTVFNKVEVINGIDTAIFRKIYSIQAKFDTKDRTKHSHHAIDAAVLTLIPAPSIKKFLRKEYHQANDKNLSFTAKPLNWDNYHSNHIHGIEDDILINFQAKHNTLTPTSKKIRKRGKIVYYLNKEGKKVPKMAKGDAIRGQLHQESIFGAIKKPVFDSSNKAINIGGKFQHEEKVSYVKRVHLEVNTLNGFKYDKKTDKDLNKFKAQFDNIIDPIVKQVIIEEVNIRLLNKVEPESIFLEPIFMIAKNGKKPNLIKKVRVFQGNINPSEIKKIAGTKGVFLSKHLYKQTTYAANTEYICMVCYKGFTENGKSIYHFKPFNALYLSREKSIPSFEIQNQIHFSKIWELKPGNKIILLKTKEENLKELNKSELNKRIYLVNNVYPAYVKKYEYFYADINYHISVVYKEIKLPKRNAKINYNNPIETPLIRLNLDPNKSNFLIENLDFKINIDGSILWMKNT